jgi:hypothetical protein
MIFLATDGGLWELLLDSDLGPVQVGVTEHADQGFSAISAYEDVRGVFYVAVSTNNQTGVYLSRAGGKSGSFSKIGLEGRDVGELAIQRDNVRAFLWGGLSVPGTGHSGRGAPL